MAIQKVTYCRIINPILRNFTLNHSNFPPNRFCGSFSILTNKYIPSVSIQSKYEYSNSNVIKSVNSVNNVCLKEYNCVSPLLNSRKYDKNVQIIPLGFSARFNSNFTGTTDRNANTLRTTNSSLNQQNGSKNR